MLVFGALFVIKNGAQLYKTNLCGDMRRYKQEGEKSWKYRPFPYIYKHCQEVIRLFSSIKSIKKSEWFASCAAYENDL